MDEGKKREKEEMKNQAWTGSIRKTEKRKGSGSRHQGPSKTANGGEWGVNRYESENAEFRPKDRKVTSSMSERVDADDTIVAFTPRIPPHVQPFANAGGESSTRCAASRILSSGMLFLPNDGVGCEKKGKKESDLGSHAITAGARDGLCFQPT